MFTLATTDTLHGKAGTASAINWTIFGDRKTTEDNFERIAKGVLSNTTGTLYTVPGAPVKSVLIKSINFKNTTAFNVTGVTLYVGGTTDADQIISFSIPANGSAIFTGDHLEVLDSAGGVVTTGTIGPSSTIAVGTTTNLVPGSAATVANSGTPTAATFDFGLPVGSVWRSGSGAPSNGTGVNGDYYLRTSNGDVYLRSGGTYSVVGNIAATVAAGTTTTGIPGSAASVTNVGSAVAAVFNFTIPAGAVWRVGSGVPSNGTGVDGDLYLRTSNGDVYQRSGGTYSVVANLTGPAGGVTSVSNADGTLTISPTTGAVVASRAALTGDVTAAAGSNVTAVKSDLALPGNPTTTTQAPGNNSTRVATTAYVDALIAAQDVMRFMGVIDASANPNYPAGNKGDTYRISVAGKIGGASGPNVEIGDLIIGLTDGSATGNHATVGANWSIAQTNIDGAVVGPASATDNRVALFDGSTGKLIKDSGILIGAIALLASPTFTGTPAAPTASPGTNTTQIATTAFARELIAATITDGDTTHAPSAEAVYEALLLKANLASPALTGTPTAPTAAPGTNTTQLATTAFVTAADALKRDKALLEAVQFYIYGSSLAVDQGGVTEYWEHVVTELGAAGDTSYGVSGSRIEHTVASLIHTGTLASSAAPVAGALWPGVSSRQGVVVFDALTNTTGHYASGSTPAPITGAGGDRYIASVKNSVETMLALASSQSRIENPPAAGVVYNGTWTNTNQANSSSSGGTNAFTTTAGANVVFTVPAASIPQKGPLAGRAWLLTINWDPSTFTNADISVSIDGGTPTIWTKTEFETYGTLSGTAAVVPVQFPVDNAQHTVTFTHVGTGIMLIDALVLASDNPGPIAVMAPSPVFVGSLWNATEVGYWNSNRAKLEPKVRESVALFPNAVYVESTVTAEGIIADGVHLSTRGQLQRAADLAEALQAPRFMAYMRSQNSGDTALPPVPQPEVRSADYLTDGVTNKVFTATDRTSLAGKFNRLLGTLLGSAAQAHTPGLFYWNTTEDVPEFHNSNTNVRHQLGYEEFIPVRNTSGVTINNGDVVYESGYDSGTDRALITKAQANALATAHVIGVATHSIPNNSNGLVTRGGVVHDLNTSGFTDGQTVYLSTSVAGGLQNTVPSGAGNQRVKVGVVKRSHATLGQLYVQVGVPIAEASASAAGYQSVADFNTLANGRKYSVNILDYGADPTGATSSAAALTAAQAALPQGGIIEFPAGTYQFGNVNYDLNTAHIHLRGVGYQTVFTTTSTTTPIITRNQWYQTIERITFTGPGTGQNPTATAGALLSVNAANASYGRIIEVNATYAFNVVDISDTLTTVTGGEFRFFKGSGIVKNQNSDCRVEGVTMDNNTSFPNNGGGIRVDLAASLLANNNNIIHSNKALWLNAGAGVTIPSVKGVNNFFDNSAYGLCIDGGGSVLRSQFTNCWFSSMSAAGVAMIPAVGGQSDGISFVNCDIYNNVAGTTHGVLTNAQTKKWKMVGCNIAGWTNGISLIAGAAHFPTIIGCTVGAVSAFGVNTTGLNVGAGAYGGLMIANNDVVDNTTALTLGAVTITGGGAAGAAKFRIIDNPGINPRGSGIGAAPALGALGTTHINATGFRILVTVKYAATTTAVTTINGVAQGAPAASNLVSYMLEPGSTIVFTTLLPTSWVWSGM